MLLRVALLRWAMWPLHPGWPMPAAEGNGPKCALQSATLSELRPRLSASLASHVTSSNSAVCAVLGQHAVDTGLHVLSCSGPVTGSGVSGLHVALWPHFPVYCGWKGSRGRVFCLTEPVSLEPGASCMLGSSSPRGTQQALNKCLNLGLCTLKRPEQASYPTSCRKPLLPKAASSPASQDSPLVGAPKRRAHPTSRSALPVTCAHQAGAPAITGLTRHRPGHTRRSQARQRHSGSSLPLPSTPARPPEQAVHTLHCSGKEPRASRPRQDCALRPSARPGSGRPWNSPAVWNWEPTRSAPRPCSHPFQPAGPRGEGGAGGLEHLRRAGQPGRRSKPRSPECPGLGS